MVATLVAAILVLAPAAASAPDLSAYPWFFLRTGAPPVSGETVAEVIFVGDTMFGREEGQVSGQAYSLQGSAAWLTTADLVFANLESPLVAEDRPDPNIPPAIRLRGDPFSAFILAAGGVNLASLANNHRFDFGPAAVTATASHLRAVNISPVLAEPVVRTVRGVRLAFLAADLVGTPQLPPQDAETTIAAIRAIRPHADAVVVSLHWGFEYEPWPDPSQERLAQHMVAAGADLIVGHHSHVAQPVVQFDESIVAFSLGNFLFDQATVGAEEGLALRAFFDADGLCAVQALPVVAGLRPRLRLPDEAEFLTRLSPPLPRAGYACNDGDCEILVAPPRSIGSGGPFWSGSIDLTGDGEREQVRRTGERLEIYRRGKLVWTSPPAWRVGDAALGDPNDDGRGEIMLAVWKADPDGFVRSHPFIVGYRGGSYQLLWGGRAVKNLIHEVELADVDGDGRQELLVLEERADGAGRQIAAWRWHGWGFSLVWYSLPGKFLDLHLHPQDGAPPHFSVAAQRQP